MASMVKAAHLQLASETESNISHQENYDVILTPDGKLVHKSKQDKNKPSVEEMRKWYMCGATEEYNAMFNVEKIESKLPETFKEDANETFDRLVDNGLCKYLEELIDEHSTPTLEKKTDFERFLERELAKKSTHKAQLALKEKILQLEKQQIVTKIRRERNNFKLLKKRMQTPKTFNNVDPVKEARRQAKKARMQIARLKEAAREANRLTVEEKTRNDPYAAVKARNIQNEQEERKFLMQNPHNGLAHKVRVMSGYSKPNSKRH